VEEFFAAVTSHLLTAEQEAGVNHHVLLSIVGIDRVPGNPHYVGKRRPEELVKAAPIPTTIVRATQFYEFPGQVLDWTRQNGRAELPPLLMQPIDIGDLAQVLADVATDPPQDRTIEFAGPETQDLIDMVRRLTARRDESFQLVPTWHAIFSAEMAGDVLLPGSEARIGSTTFEQWLACQ
jgi:uncharacterized protein YbjT (DUF2867 family)